MPKYEATYHDVREMKSKPMLAMLVKSGSKEFEALLKDDNWIGEIKYDGTRALLTKTGDEVVLQNRHGLVINKQFAEVVKDASELPDGMYDGEIVFLKDGKEDFDNLRRRQANYQEHKFEEYRKLYPATYIIFDMLFCNLSHCFYFYGITELIPIVSSI